MGASPCQHARLGRCGSCQAPAIKKHLEVRVEHVVRRTLCPIEGMVEGELRGIPQKFQTRLLNLQKLWLHAQKLNKIKPVNIVTLCEGVHMILLLTMELSITEGFCEKKRLVFTSGAVKKH